MNDNYRLIRFALNRAVCHKELTADEANKEIANLAALVAVAEAAIQVSSHDSLKYLPKTSTDALRDSLASLAAVREGEAVQS